MITKIFQVVNLIKSSKVNVNATILNTTKKRAASTILILSLIFVICNLSSILIWVVVYHDYMSMSYAGNDKQNSDKTGGIKSLSWLQLWLIYFSGTTLFLISSTLTPLVIVLRGDFNQQNGLSRFFWELSRIFSSFRFYKVNKETEKIVMNASEL